MKQFAVRVGSSNHEERMKELKENHEQLQKMLADGWQVTDAKVRRPRHKVIKQPKEVVVTLGGEWTLRMSFNDYQLRGSGLKVVMRMY